MKKWITIRREDFFDVLWKIGGRVKLSHAGSVWVSMFVSEPDLLILKIAGISIAEEA